jgi:hypothetical protein
MEWIKRIAALWTDGVQAGPERLLTKDERTEAITKITVRADSINGAIHELNMKAYGKGWGYRPCMRDSLSEYSDRTLIVILNYLMQDTVGKLPLHHKSSFMRQITRPESDTDEITIREFITLQPYIQMLASVGPNNYFSMLRAIHEYAPIPAMRDYSDADHETKRQIAALVTVTANMYQEYVEAWNDETYSERTHPSHLSYLPLSMSGGVRINDEKLTNLVMEHPDKAEAIATVIIDDKIADASLVLDRVISSSQSLREGIL